MTDPIADMLTRIRNGLMAGRSSILVPHSGIKEAIAKILADQHFIGGYKVSGQVPTKMIEIDLGGQRPVSKVTRVSKPGRRVYLASKQIPTVLSGRGLVIVSTSHGLMAGHEARRQGLGGELICQVW
ncbi:MAG TPA: 30S ribosomal protein S8 [Candidatus Saccharimonadales bacterium]|nr:30S ribosomal protein S8 [Candidatus Saccharimonadales bacterium]